MHTRSLIALSTLVLFLSTACLTAPAKRFSPHSDITIRSADIAVTPRSAVLACPVDLNIYSMVHSLYAGLILQLDLVDELSLPAKHRLITAVWSSAVEKILIDGYFEKEAAALILKPNLRTGPPRRLEWRSNAVYSPLTKGPLRGQGEFLSSEAKPMSNISETVMVVDSRAVRLCNLYSRSREEQLLAEKARLHLAHFYLHDGRRDNDHMIPGLLEGDRAKGVFSANQAAALELSRVQYELYSGKYSAALQRLSELCTHVTELSPPLRRLFRFTYEEYCLCRAIDLQNPAYLIEYSQFTRGDQPEEDAQRVF
ncbi:MAG: hypothetical protein ACOCZA_04860 [Spirochaetota bacterium]